MTNVRIPRRVVSAMQTHGEETYPEECCGFLVGSGGGESDPAVLEVERVVRAENRVEGDRERRFVIPPEELMRLERSLEPNSERVVGFYHSHPDHPARPSAFDQTHAWPWYTYVVLSVIRGRADGLGAFELNAESRAFVQLDLAIAEGEPHQELPPG